MKTLSRLSVAAAAIAVFATPVHADHLRDGRKLDAMLNGANEVPNAGDPDGMGMIISRTNPGSGEFCYTLTVMDIATPTAAHIHKGAAGEAGPVVATLSTPSTGESTGCVDIPRNLARAIVKNPDEYYINVHNAEYPGGAVRGQLAK